MGVVLYVDGEPTRRGIPFAYGSFFDFRARITQDVEHVYLDRMVGHGGSRPWSDHPVVPLLDHSDCDGELSPVECATVGPALRAIVEAWKDDGVGHRSRGLEIADAMARCVAKNRPLIFG